MHAFISKLHAGLSGLRSVCYQIEILPEKCQVLDYSRGGEPMARVPKVARETISRGTPSLRNLPRNSS